MTPDPARRRAWESEEDHRARMRAEGRSLCPICARYILVSTASGRLRTHRWWDTYVWDQVTCPGSRRLQPLRSMTAVR